MPPRKPAQADPETPVQSTPSARDQNDNISEDMQQGLALWTDEQEIVLLKGIIRWKPVGMHKHFRMIAIHNYMISQGVVNPDDEHTSIPGLWTKLGSLYNLPILDEREDSILHSSSDENESPDALYAPYDLPDEYDAMKFDKRINLDGSKSPPLVNSREESTIADADEPGSSPAPGRRGGRVPRRGGRVSKLQQEAESSQRTSKAASATEDEPMEDARDDEGEEEDDSDDANEEEEPEESPKASSSRGRGTSSRRGGRGRGGTRGKGRRK